MKESESLDGQARQKREYINRCRVPLAVSVFSHQHDVEICNGETQTTSLGYVQGIILYERIRGCLLVRQAVTGCHNPKDM